MASPRSAIDSLRKILFAAAALLAGAALLAPATAGAAGARSAPPALAGGKQRRPRLVHAELTQAGRELVFSVRTSAPVSLAKLEARPDTRRAAARYLCLALGALGGGGGERRLCLGGGSRAKRRAGLVVVDAAGKPLRRDSVPARVKRPEAQKLVLSFDPREAGLAPQRYGWRALLSRGCGLRRRCAQQLPAEPAKPRTYRLRPVRAVGCSGGSAGMVSSGPSDRPLVALSFDDGPSEYTDEFLDVLRAKEVPATFFEIGQEMPGREDVMRRILAEGDEIGDHTMNHVELPGYDQIAGAATLIRRYTHFQPCLFRPPGGAVNAGVIATAGALGMRTVTWDVDPRDWALPGSGAIHSNVVANARDGSIILMHDGGGPREETLAALPGVIDALRARGFGFATVSELLGYRLIYRPYG
ncbi:MAG: polysaccharide deacetylase family protein [Solirubrobacterales bacterium]